MDIIRGFLQRLRMMPSDEELGRRSSIYPDETVDAQSGKPVSIAEDALATSEKLKEFRMLVGITTHPSFKAPRGYNTKQRPMVTAKGRPAPNVGLYPTVVANEFKLKRNYKRFSLTTNLALGLQIIVAAALTALGASDSSSKAVTVFGAINTVIAGFLTYLKGSGLPHRLKYYQHQWAKLREYIEHRERDLGTPRHDHNIDIHREVNIIRQIFEDIKNDAEQNEPDRFVGSGKIGASLLHVPPIPLSESRSDVEDKIGGLMSGLQSARSKVAGMLRDGSTTAGEVHQARGQSAEDVSIVKSRLLQRMREIEDLEKGVIDTEVATQTKSVVFLGDEVKEFITDRSKEVDELEKEIANVDLGAHQHSAQLLPCSNCDAQRT